MILLTHSLAGEAIGTQTNNIAVAFLLGMISHFVLDAIPHFDQGTIEDPFGNKNKPWKPWVYWTFALDLIISILVLLYFRHRADFIYMLWGTIGAISVDIIENYKWPVIKNWPLFKQISWIHNKIHFWLPTNKWYIGLTFEILITGGLVWYLLKF